jgi:hypothetical protein
MTHEGHRRIGDIAGQVGGSNQSRTMGIALGHFRRQAGRIWKRLFVHNPTGKRDNQHLPWQGSTKSGVPLTLHLKQSRWNVPPSARTNCPVNSSPHFLQSRSCPLPFRAPCVRMRSRSPLTLGVSISRSLPWLLTAGDPDPVPSAIYLCC